MIGNILLVLGMSILMGGLKYKEQRFSKQAAHSEATMAIVAAVAFLVPAIFHSIVTSASTANSALSSTTDEHPLSLGIAVLLIVTYALMLFFQLRTHAAWFNEKGRRRGPGRERGGRRGASSSSRWCPRLRTWSGATSGRSGEAGEGAESAMEEPLQTTPVPIKRHRTLHSMIALDPDPSVR